MNLQVRDAQPNDLPALIAMLVDDSIGRQYESAPDDACGGYAAAFEAILASEILSRHLQRERVRR
jgi:hypothetical protein